MLLTCNSCRNTYVIDDATVQANGGRVLCEQCQEPLVPLIAGEGNRDKTSILDGFNFDSLENQWRKNQLAGNGGPPGQPGVPGAPGMGAPPPVPGGQGGPGQQPGPGGQPPATQAIDPVQGPPPGLGSPPGMPGGGQGGGSPMPTMALSDTDLAQGNFYGGAPQQQSPPPPTQALDPVQAPPHGGGQAPPGEDQMYIAPGESTVALDLDNMVQKIDGPGQNAPGGGAGQEDPQASTQAFDPRQAEKLAQQRKQVIVGGGVQHNERTAAIDVSQVDAYMSGGQGQGGQQGQHGQQGQYQQSPQPRQIPGMQHPGAMAPPQKSGGGMGMVFLILFILLLVGGGVAAVFLFVLDDSSGSSSGGESGEEEEVTELSYQDRVAAIKNGAVNIMRAPIEGEIPSEGLLIPVNTTDGLYYEDQLLVSFSGDGPSPDQLESGSPYITDFGLKLNEAPDSSPIVTIPDMSMPFGAFFPVLYTASTTGRRVLIAGDTVSNPNLLGTVELQPWEWPKPPVGEFNTPTKETDLRLIVDKDKIVVTGRGVNPEGVKKNELVVQKLISSYDIGALKSALAAAKTANSELEAVRFVPSASVPMGTLADLVQVVRGEDYNFPRFKAMYLEPPR